MANITVPQAHFSARPFAFTIATGKAIYLTMACSLARSFLRFNDAAEIGFAIITDRPVEDRPDDLAQIVWVQISDGVYGKGFTPKLHLDMLAPADRALFIDADCLCVASLAPAFEAFRARPVSVIGRHISKGDWFGDTADICARLEVESYPRFNGGVYYLERGEACKAIYETARQLLPRYDELGFKRLRGSPNDEVVMAAAMALHGAEPIAETGKIMNTLMAAPGGIDLDVLKGRAILRNPKRHPNHNSWYTLEEMRPALVHFLGQDIVHHPYRTEITALDKVARGWPETLARIYARLVSELPDRLIRGAKGALRPAYHRFFGTRAVRESSR